MSSLLAQNAALTEQVGALTELSEYVERLEHLVEEFRRALYGKGSEKLTEEQRQFACEEIEVAIAEVENTGEEPETSEKASPRKRAPKRNHGSLPQEFEREMRVIEPESLQCPCGCGEMTKI